MNSVLVRYNPEIPNDFWEKNPQFILIPEFKVLKSKKDSSLIMWGLAILLERTDNEFAELPIKERTQFIEDYVWEGKFKVDKLTKEINAYQTIRHGVLERQLEELENKLEDRADFLKSEKYNIDNAKILDGLILSSDSIIDKVMSLRRKLYESNTQEGKTQGDREESFLEKM